MSDYIDTSGEPENLSGAFDHEHQARLLAEAHGLSLREAMMMMEEEQNYLEQRADMEAERAHLLALLDTLEGIATRVESGCIVKLRDGRALRNIAKTFRKTL